MSNLSNYELEIANNFLGGFTASVVRVLSKQIDKDVFDKFDFVIDSSLIFSDIATLKENNVVCNIEYTEGEEKGSLVILFPEELISTIADVLMGGDGKDVYKGSLTELQINAFSGLINKVFEDITNVFEEIYKRSLDFNEKIQIIDKSSEDYEEEFLGITLDLAVNHILTINNEKKFKVTLLLDSDKTKHALIKMGILQEEELEDKGNQIASMNMGFSSINIDQITDIKIDISAELGKSKISLKQVLGLDKGSVIELDSLNDSDITVFANGLEVAKAQIVVVDDNFGIRITKIISPQERLKEI